MSRPTFLEGALVAGVAGVASGVLFTALAPVLGAAAALRLLAAGLGLAYLLYLLGRAARRTGRVTAVAAWAVVTLAAWWLAPSVVLFGLAQAGMAWLVRALYFHGGVLAALADLGLVGFGLAAGAAALAQTGSVALAAWCLFLVQALFIALPAGIGGSEPVAPAGEPDPFQQAHRAAEAAVRRLSTLR